MERIGRAERLLPYACAIAAGVLFVSQLMTLFEFIPPGAEAIDDRSAIQDHGAPLFIVAGFALIATFVAVWGPSKPAAIAVGAMGLFALLFFLLTDLPDAGQIGTIDDARQSFIDAEAVPQGGFWLEMLGALGLAVSGIALATMTPAQLHAMRPGSKRRVETEAEESAPAAGTPYDAETQAPADTQGANGASAERPTRRTQAQ